MKRLNLGIVAHVDAGKTSLTERLLHTAGVIHEVGRVDDGSTQTDSHALERQRGITIKSAVVSFVLDDVTVNLIDTPGHPDFIAEVERVLSVLDGAVLVVSAVEGVQSQTRVLMRILRRLGIPTLIFVNKIDRRGAREAGLLRDIADRLTPAVLAMGSTLAIGTREASFSPSPHADGRFLERLVDLLADHDDAFLADYVASGSSLTAERLRAQLAAQTARASVHPVYFGSAITGAGIDELSTGITNLLPSASGGPDQPLRGSVFKVERGPSGDKIAYLRMFTGAVRVRDRLQHGPGRSGKITAIEVFDGGGTVNSLTVEAGQIARVRGLAGVRIGDAVGGGAGAAGQRLFAPPTLETVVVPDRATERGLLHAALMQLAEQDPLINLRQDEGEQEISVSLYGEVQKEVIEATLADEFGLAVSFRETTTLCIERPTGRGSAVELIGKEPNPFLATVGLRIDPAPLDTGVEFRLEVELGSMPYSFFRAVEETVRETLGQGLHGWRVTDCVVTYTHCGYYPRQSHAHATFDKSMSSTAGDFRLLTPLVVVEALRQAGTQVYEPFHSFHLEGPADTFPAMLQVLGRLGAQVSAPVLDASRCTLEGVLPAARVHDVQRLLPGSTRGEGVLDSSFEHYQAVRGAVPTRARSRPDAAHRKEYLLQVERRVAT